MTIKELANIGISIFDMIYYITLDKLIATVTCNGEEYITEHYVDGKCYFVLHHGNENITLTNITRIDRKENGSYKECYPTNTLENKNNVNL